MKGNESKNPRMDDILSLPVQDPPSSEFSAVNLNWVKVYGGRQGGDDIALIPYLRVGDFVKGESSNAECPASFRVESRRKRSEGSISKPRVDGYLEYTLYWCSYGPEDYRDSNFNSGIFPASKPSSGKGSRPGRRHMMRGCLCHFTVKRLYARPLLALIIYNHRNHIDKTGVPCHGVLDRESLGTRAMYAPRISEELRQKIMSMIYVGISVDNIIQHHADAVERQGGPSNRDDFLTRNDIRNMERAILRFRYELHTDDAHSVKMWVQRHQRYVFFFQENCEMGTFVLGIQTEWQLQQMLDYGHNRFLASHLNFGLNSLRFPLHTLLVFDSCQNVIPIAWVITANTRTQDVYSWTNALLERVRTKDPTWRPNAFLVDDVYLDVSIIRHTFQCRVLLCLWRIRRAWLKSIFKRCSNFDVQKEMFMQLGHILYYPNATNTIEEFMQIFIDQRAFIEHFKKRWSPKIEMWISAMQTLPVSHQELNGAIESYHLKLKELVNNAPTSSSHRLDWLVHSLTTKIHSMYWFNKYSEEFGQFTKYSEELFPSNSWHRALRIPDLDVILDEENSNSNFVKVISQSSRSLTYTIWNHSSEFSFCNCAWSSNGNLCKHVIKVSILSRDRLLARPSLASQVYRQTLINLLENPPEDPLVLDHAIVHATRMQHDLKGLEDLSNSGLLHPLSTMETGALFGEGILSQELVPGRITRSKRWRDENPGLNMEASQLDFREHHEVPCSNQMGVLDLLGLSQGSNLINSIGDQEFISNSNIVDDI